MSIAVPASPHTELSRGFVLIMSLACGLCAGANYFNQPLIYAIATDLHTTTTQAALTVVLAQVGYGLGLLFLVPLGDLLEKRRFIISLMVLSATAQILLSLSDSLVLLYSMTLGASFFSIAAQVLIPFAATLSPSHKSAEIVGVLMSGLVMGILLARTFAGFISTTLSWHYVYLLSGMFTLMFAVVMWHKLPTTQPNRELKLLGIYRSLIELAYQQPHLIRRGIAGGLGFGILAMIFTTMTFILANPPYLFNEFQIGFFGLLGVIGIFATRWSGKTIGQGKENFVAILCSGLLLLGWIPLAFARMNLGLYALGVLMCYFGLTAFHVLNQNLVYRISIQARSRINAVYMTLYFSGAALGSLCTVYAWAHWSWPGCVLLGIVYGSLILAIDRYDFRQMRQADSSSVS